MTVTPERRQRVDFTEPWIAGVDEIIVTSPDGPSVETLDDLSGKEIFVRESSSYFQSLGKLNERFKQEGKRLVTLTPAPEELEDEDLMEMANAGLVKILVVDNHKAWFWQRVWPKLTLHPTVAVRSGGEIAWAIRKNSPKLLETINRFLDNNGPDSLNSRMMRSGSSNGTPRMRTALTNVNTALLAPRPRARATTAARVNHFSLIKSRTANRTS